MSEPCFYDQLPSCPKKNNQRKKSGPLFSNFIRQKPFDGDSRRDKRNKNNQT